MHKIGEYQFFSVEKCLSSVDCKGKTLDETVGNLLAERSRLLGAEEATVS